MCRVEGKVSFSTGSVGSARKTKRAVGYGLRAPHFSSFQFSLVGTPFFSASGFFLYPGCGGDERFTSLPPRAWQESWELLRTDSSLTESTIPTPLPYVCSTHPITFGNAATDGGGGSARPKNGPSASLQHIHLPIHPPPAQSSAHHYEFPFFS